MSLTRRQFTQSALLGTLSFSASSGIFFPKPVESQTINLKIEELQTRSVWQSLLLYGGIKLIDFATSPRVNRQARATVSQVEQSLVVNGFNDNKTPYGIKELAEQEIETSIIFGQEKSERDSAANLILPNPGFGIVQPDATATFTGPTSVGISKISEILRKQHQLSPDLISDLVLPWQSQFEDIGDWSGEHTDYCPNSCSLLIYRSSKAQVIRRYDRISTNRGVINIEIDADQIGKYKFTLNVPFA